MKAIALLSGGLDSTLAAKLILQQGIEVIALNFTSPFCLCNQKGKCSSAIAALQLGIPLKTVNKFCPEYVRILRNPKHGFGSEANPCIDCRIFMLKKTRKIAKQLGAKFIFTGEVLGQRPMSQHFKALQLIEKEAGLQGKLLRPLSAKLLPETEAGKKKWVDVQKLLALHGRTRKPQIKLAEEFNIADYPCASGGCLLTYHEFACKVKDLLKHKKKVNARDFEILKVGRHFRHNGAKIIVGRNKEENEKLLALKQKSDFVFEAFGCGSPITLLQGIKSKKAVEIAARLTARYSDSKQKKTLVNYGMNKSSKEIIVQQLTDIEIKELNLNVVN